MEHAYLNVLKCSCLLCRQNRVRTWVSKLLYDGVPIGNIHMEINKYGGKVIIHYLGKERICYQFNDKSFDWAMIWWQKNKTKQLQKEIV